MIRKHFWRFEQKVCGCSKRVWIKERPFCFEELKSILREQNI